MTFQSLLPWLAGLFLLIACAGPVRAETLRFGYDEYPPLSYTEDGEARGRSIELIREASRRLGIRPVFVSQPFIRLFVSVREGVIDGIVDLYETPERAEHFYFSSGSATSESLFIYVRAHSGVRIGSVEDAKRYVVGAVRGYYYGETVDRQLQNELVLVKDSKVLYRMLLEGRLDAAIGNSLAAEHYMGRQLDNAEVLPVLELACLNYRIALSRSLGPKGRRLADLYSQEIRRILEERGEPVPAP